MRKMTKKQVVAAFRDEVWPEVLRRYGHWDGPALSEAWNNYTDSLHKDGLITRRAYETWTTPKMTRTRGTR